MGQPAQKGYFDSLVGKTISNRYKLEAKIGAGAMGAVFQGVNLENNQAVAIKVISPDLVSDEKFVKRFEREADLGKLLKHPNIVSVEEFGQTEDRLFFIAMEFVPGETLKSYLANSGVLAPERSLELLAPLCHALDFAHKHNVLHRDLKPENILVAKDSSGKEILKLADFGIAKRTDLSKTKDQMLTVEGEIFGTPHYMSPEQVLAQKLKPTTDVYGVGVMFYQMLSGHLPLEHPKAQQLLVMKVSQDIAPISKTYSFVSPLFDPVFRRVLSRSPSERYQSAGDLLKDVQNIVAMLTSAPQSENATDKKNFPSIASSETSLVTAKEKPEEAKVTKSTSQKVFSPPRPDMPKKTPLVPPVKHNENPTHSQKNTSQNTKDDKTMLVAGLVLGILIVAILVVLFTLLR